MFRIKRSILKPITEILYKTITKDYCSKIVSESASMKILNVAEKNDAAKSIAGVMSRNGFQRREGFSPYNKIYQYEYMLNGQHVTMIMTSVSGHLQDLDFSGQYKNWQSFSPLVLFDAPIMRFVPDRYEPIKRTLEREAKGSSKLIIWTDCDREGENIGFEIIDVVKKVNPRIQVLRAKFSEITTASVNRAISNLTQPDELQNAAVEVRRELDLRIGAAFTRFLTLRYRVAFPELADFIISYGSCQFPTLGFVVERYKQIQEFVPEAFWKLKVMLEEDGKKVDFTWKRVRLFDYDAVRALYELCISQPQATVTDVRQKSKSKWRPVALDTVEFEKSMSRKLKITAKQAMQIAEKLYTSGFISYPRTETNIFPKELNLRELVQNQTEDSRWGEFAGQLLETGVTPRNGNKSDQAHPPIHPTKYAPNLSGQEKQVYEFIVRHFLACCSQDAKGFETTVEVQIVSEKFTAGGLVILERNYLDVYPYEKWSDKDIPNFTKGDVYQPSSIEMLSGETSPPNLLTEADLIALMEKHGIGTDATHAEHIEKILERNYAGVQDHKFLPGKLGMGLVEGYDSLGFEFSKPFLRSALENDLKMICEGRKHKDAVLKEQIQKYKEKFEVSLARVAAIDEQMKKYLGAQMNDPGPTHQQQGEGLVSVMKCPSCGSDMALRQKSSSAGDSSQAAPSQASSTRSGFYIGCLAYPQCRSAIWLPKDMVAVTVLNDTCSNCGPDTKLLSIKFKPGSVPPYMDEDYTCCVKCDRNLQEIFNLSVKSGSATAPPTAGSSRKNNQTTTHNTRNENNPTLLTTNRNVAHNFSQPNTSSQAGPRVNRNASSNSTQPNNNNSQAIPRANKHTSNSLAQPNNNSSQAARRSVLQDVTDEDNKPVCMCNEPAILLTVKKEGANQGRTFYKCIKGTQEGGCNFFCWADQPQPSTSTASYGSFNRTERNHNVAQDNGSETKCNCNAAARRLTVQKEGANKGREFFTCQKPRDQGCGFFQWADQQSPDRNNSTNYGGKQRKSAENRTPSSGKRKCGHCRQEGHTIKKCPQLID